MTFVFFSFCQSPFSDAWIVELSIVLFSVHVTNIVTYFYPSNIHLFLKQDIYLRLFF